jgi:hypothetical protein
MLSRLVDDPDRFLTGWPGRPVVYQPHDARLTELFSRDDARTIVADPTLRPIELGMVRQGSPAAIAPDADHPTHTLVFNGLHLTWPLLRDATRVLAAEIGHPVTANVYLTPPGSTGYGPHWDTHHVLLAQVSGEKTWRLHPPIVTDPLDRHRWTAVGFTPDQLDQIRNDADAVTITAGQVLYIPRGWVHFGHTTDEHSLHITFGVQLLTRHWVLQQLVEQAAEMPEMREALPPGLSTHPVEGLVDDARNAVRAFLDSLDPQLAGHPVYIRQQRAVLGNG